jgi:dihydrolipoamide dehydrogenase
MKFDIIIVGAGPGGYVAAVRAAQLGMKTAIVEREHLGGICLNWGCIPTKALLRSAEVFELMRNAKDYGLAADNVRIDADAIVQRSRAVSGRLSQGVSSLLKKNKVQTIWGEALLTAPGRLSVAESAVRSSRPRPDKPAGALGSGDYTADHIVIATGARPRILPGLEPDGERIWTYFEAMTARAPAGHWLGRDRRRVRVLLQRTWLEGDYGRSASADPAGGRRRDRKVRSGAV